MNPYTFRTTLFFTTAGVAAHHEALVENSDRFTVSAQLADRLLLSQSFQSSEYFQILAEADSLYRNNQYEAAESLYRQAKPSWSNSSKQDVKEPVYETDITQLSGAVKIYWKNVLEGIDKGLETQIFTALGLLIDEHPYFIPAHLKLAELCQAQPESCEDNLKDDQPTKASEILDRALILYPDDPDLTQAKVDALVAEGNFLSASITARQYAQLFTEYPEAPAFQALADEYLERYETETRRELNRANFLNIGISIVRVITSGDISQGVSGLQSLGLLLQGEKAVGQEAANQFLEEYADQGKIVENVDINNYVAGIAGRFTPYIGRDFEYEFYVVRDNTLNAFVLPGGKVFVNTGAILNTNSEAELAGILAHEVSHAALSHGVQSVTSSLIFSNLREIFPAASVITSLANGQNSQAQERQADILGTKVLSSAGYAADGILSVMNRLDQIEQASDNSSSLNFSLSSFFESHPPSAQRVNYIQSLIQNNGYNRYAYEGVETHAEVQNLISQL